MRQVQLKRLPTQPTFLEERSLMEAGYDLVAGIDEVGRGALAGPVVAAAVVLPSGIEDSWFADVRDSKLLTPDKRESLFPLIQEKAVAVGVGTVPARDIDAMGILRATRIAMRLAVEHLRQRPHFLIIDAITIPSLLIPQRGIIKGDRLCLSIACASIVAKVTRDRQMVEMDSLYPGYGLAGNKGYGTTDHLAGLTRLGPSPIHRRNFSPMRKQLL